ncbi:hypothetical protein V5N11_016078 [Cardamine amara subsp. amara]|uniref:CCHC-type domain-containing protein n=1 Tax=Cardamine amara subsp. amara TaxID=228776 RepID=A0ABD1B622_CARAN
MNGDQSSGGQAYVSDQTELAAAYNTYRPRGGNRPVCTFCGKLGHTVQKCYKVHGFPPGIKQNTQFQGNQFQGNASPAAFVPRHQSQFAPRPQFNSSTNYVPPPSNFVLQQRSVANVFSGVNSSAPMAPMPYYVPPPAVNVVNLDIGQMSQIQLQTFMQQLNAHVRAPKPPAPPSQASISENGGMALQSSCGVFSGIDDWEG